MEQHLLSRRTFGFGLRACKVSITVMLALSTMAFAQDAAKPAPRAVGGVKRPTPINTRKAQAENTPGANAADNAPINKRPAPEDIPKESFELNMNGVPLLEIINAVAARTGKNFYLEGNIGETVITVITQEGIPAELSMELLEAILAANDFVLQETLDGYLIQLVPTAEKHVEKIPIFLGDVPLPDGFDQLSTHILPVLYADAAEISDLLLKYGSPAVKLEVYANTNTLILTDTTDGVRTIKSILNQIDVPGQETELEMFTLDYAQAAVVAQQLQDILMPEGEAGRAPNDPAAAAARRPVPPVRTVRTSARSAVPGTQTEAGIVGSSEKILRIVSDERLNMLVVVASTSIMEDVRRLIDALDPPTPYEANNMHYVPLQNAKAEDVSAALGELTGTGARTAGDAGGGALSAEVLPFEKQVKITVYEQSNALLIIAAAQDFKLLDQIITQLDVPPRQVHVEALILEVGINDNYSIQVETAALTSESGFGLNNVAKLAQILSGDIIGAGVGLGLTGGFIDGTTNLPISTPIMDANGNITGAATSLQKVPNVPILLTALETLGDVNVLSAPSLTTLNNEEASFDDGIEIGVPTSLNDTDQRTGFLSRSRVQREKVGVKLEVTPQINEGDVVAMELNIEVSSLAQTPQGVDVNQLGPTFNKANIQNKIVVKDGATAVLGGILKEDKQRSVGQAPILGDLPLIGWLFQNRANIRTKRNLVAFITPYIVTEGTDMDRLSQYKMDEFTKRAIDEIFEKGFIRKVMKKRDSRKNYRPTDSAREQVRGARSFDRGAMN